MSLNFLLSVKPGTGIKKEHQLKAWKDYFKNTLFGKRPVQAILYISGNTGVLKWKKIHERTYVTVI